MAGGPKFLGSPFLHREGGQGVRLPEAPTSPAISREVPLARGGLLAERRGGEGSAEQRNAKSSGLRQSPSRSRGRIIPNCRIAMRLHQRLLAQSPEQPKRTIRVIQLEMRQIANRIALRKQHAT